MMMTSTFPTSRSDGRNIRNGLKEIQVKRESLLTLEAILKKRIDEFRELCLREGELTGHLPADYPLQPREPIPQVRRRVTRSSGNILQELSAPANTIITHSVQNRLVQRPNGQLTTMTLPSTISQPPSRPTSTNSSSSTSSSQRHHSSIMNAPIIHNFNHNSYSNNGMAMVHQQKQNHNAPMKQYDPHNPLTYHFKKPQNLTSTNSNFDVDSLGQMRASSTASSSSSSGSAVSSTASAFAIPYNNYLLSDLFNPNLHGRSYSEDVNSAHPVITSNKPTSIAGSETSVQRQGLQSNFGNIRVIECNNSDGTRVPIRPPRGINHNIRSDTELRKNPIQMSQLSEKQTSEGNITGLSINGSPLMKHHPARGALEEPPNLTDLTNGLAKFQPYYEETKPFQMSDFYKYSSKHRQKMSNNHQPGIQLDPQIKTTRQLQEDVSKAKSSLKFAACDDQIQQSVRLIERSGQKLIEATAKAITGNPSLAEKLNNILPYNHHRNGQTY